MTPAVTGAPAWVTGLVADRRRLDRELVRRELVASRERAREVIAAGRVRVDGLPAHKPASLVDASAAIALTGDEPAWASRAAHKLLGALAALPDLPVAGRCALDAGASTGGFTDVLLAHGARHVLAVDVGYGQLVWRLRSDPRVTVLDRTNVRHLSPDALPARPELVTGDLSFISLRTVLPALAGVCAPDGDLLLLVKPQFEVGRERVGGKGVVRDPTAWRAALAGVVDAGAAEGLALVGACASPQPGPKGNVELFAWLSAARAPAEDPAAVLDAAVDQARAVAAR